MRERVSSGTDFERRYSYSRAIRTGNRVLVAGTTATAADGSVVGVGDAEAQAEFIIDRIEHAIQKLGGRLEDVIRTRVYVTDRANWRRVAQVHGRRFEGILPANTLIMAELVGPDYLVEIEAEAVVEE